MPDVIEHIGYSFDNDSNFDIRKKELDHILDIPVYAAQNLILDTQSINIYNDPRTYTKLPVFVWNSEVYYLLAPHEDQRFVFLKYDDESRLLDYRFGGRVYAQSREGAGFSLSPDSFYLFGGNVSETDDMRDLWRLDLDTKTWIPEFVLNTDQPISDFPSDRRNTNLTVAGAEKFIFGGEVYIEIGNNVITLNDLWWHDGTDWHVLDPDAVLPHEAGLVVWFDASIIKVVSQGDLYTVYKNGTTTTTVESYTGSVSPPPTPHCMSFYENGGIYWSDFKSHVVYSWDNASDELVLEKSNALGVGYDASDLTYYVTKITQTTQRGGGSSYQPEIEIHTPIIRNWSDDLIDKTCSFDAVPLGEYMATCDLDDGRKYLGLGLRSDVFIEDHYLWDGNTNQTIRIGSDSTKPQERMLAGCCYDAARNRIWLFGGYTGSIYYNDLWYLSLGDYTWHRVSRRRTKLVDAAGKTNWPAARAQPGLCVVEDTLWIVAGYSDERSYADMWKYDITNDSAEIENLTDWVAFGSDYFLFQWRDRLWLFNGEYKLYRYFFEHKQFAPVTIYATRYPEIQEKITAREYITAPMRLVVQNNNLIISYLDSKSTSWTSFFIDMESKEITQYPGSISSASFWYDQTRGLDTTGYLYFYNVSPFDFAQRNTFPYYEEAVDPILSPNPLSKESCLMEYWDENTGSGLARLSYLDAHNMYIIYTDQVDYQPLLPTFSDMTGGTSLSYWPQADFSVVDGTEDAEQIESKETVGQGRFRTIPRFLWRRVPSGYSDLLRKASLTWQDDVSNRTYLVNSQTGNILRYRSEDGTFFNYPSKTWPEGSTAHSGNIMFAIGGNNQQHGAPPGLGQNGLQVSLTAQQWEILEADEKPKPLCHIGVMLYDLNYLSFQLRLLKDNTDIEERDYDQIRDYLVGSARSQLNLNINGTELTEDWIDTISAAVYSDTISIVGDLSVRNVINETGVRPFGLRTGGLSAQAGNLLYYGGGALKWQHEVGVPGKLEKEIETKYSNYYPDYDTLTGAYYKRYYDDFHVFNLNSRSWVELAPLPLPVYGGSLITTPDETKIYLIGGYIADDLDVASNKIYMYTIATDTWSEIKPLPTNYGGRALPVVKWLDNSRLLIMFGMTASRANVLTDFMRLPLPDAWLLDIKNNTMYKIFENTSKTSIIMSSIEDGDIHMLDYSRVWFSNLYDQIGIEKSTTQTVSEDNGANLASNDENDVISENNFELDSTITTPADLLWQVIDPTDGQIVRTIKIGLPDTLAASLDPESIVKDFVDQRGDLWLVVNYAYLRNEGDDSTVSYNLSFYKASKEDDWNYSLIQSALDVPVDAAVRMVGYDGTRYLYCVWNEFNIWQLDMDTAVFSPNSTYWRQMPPYPDLADMGLWTITLDDNDKEVISTDLIHSEPYEGNILFYGSDGVVVRFDPYNYVWRIDRYGTDLDLENSRSVVKDGAELYYYNPGHTYGTLFGLEHKQEDKFYFDAELLEEPDDVKIPIFDALIADLDERIEDLKENQDDYVSYDDCIEAGCSANLALKISQTGVGPQDIWDGLKRLMSGRRTIIKRNRILAFNANNHLMRAWVKKHGQLDLIMDFDSYYASTQIDLSVDYDTMNDQAGQYTFTAWTDSGLQTGVGNMVQVDTGYDWDPFARIYVKQVELPSSPGNYTSVESERPGYYVRFPLAADSAVTKIRIQFNPLAQESNYISRLNHVYVVHESSALSFEGDDGAISVVYVEPFDEVESDIYLIRIINNHSTDAASNVKVQLVKNYRVLLSKDNVTWKRATLSDPLDVATSLDPGQNTEFYLKALSYFDKSNLDMVIRAEYPPP